MATKKISDITVITIEGKEYLTFPQALKHIKMKRGILHQRIMREEGNVKTDEEAVNAINIDKYVFVPLTYCNKLKEDKEKEATVEKLKKFDDIDIAKLERIKELGWTIEDIEKLTKQSAKRK